MELIIPLIHHVPIPVSLLRHKRQSSKNTAQIQFLRKTWPEGQEVLGKKSLVRHSSPRERRKRGCKTSHLEEKPSVQRSPP